MATDPSTYKLNHTMLRVKDPKKSIEFYNFLGMKRINQLDFPGNKFSLYFLAYDSDSAVSCGKHWTDRQGLIELTHNYGTETQDDFKINNGNVEPHRGFGHVAISVDNIQAACKRLADAGYLFQKTLDQGSMNSIAFALDPDGYWVEIIGQKPLEEAVKFDTTDVSKYRMNHTMIRVRSAEATIKFYEQTMGMKVVRKLEFPAAQFNLYFLGYVQTLPNLRHDTEKGRLALAGSETLLEITCNYDDPGQYHNGNDDFKGFGHLCISVDDLDAACARLEVMKVNWKKRLSDGSMRDVAFIFDPDGYWIEVIQNEALKSRADW
ncbi:MAG: Lactoylglutathione lyase [Vezdaea aestivalis]|nr:MAG: Lactoylglutathione lyase [Vezdaea aestivalis]